MKLTTKQAQIIAFFRESPDATYAEASYRLGRAVPVIQKSIRALEAKGVKTWKNKDKDRTTWSRDSYARRIEYYRRVYEANPDCTITQFAKDNRVSFSTASKYLKICKGEK